MATVSFLLRKLELDLTDDICSRVNIICAVVYLMKAVNGLAEQCANKKEGNQNHISRFQFNKGKIMGIFYWLFGDTDDEED